MDNTHKNEDIEFEKEQNELERLFPNVKFTVSIPLNKLDDVVIKKTNVFVRITPTCYCCDEQPRPPAFLLYSKKGGNISNADLIKFLENTEYKVDCDHRFLEGFEIIDDYIEICFGS